MRIVQEERPVSTEQPALLPPTGVSAEDLLERLQAARAAQERARRTRAGKPVVGRWPRKLPITANNETLAARLRGKRNRRRWAGR